MRQQAETLERMENRSPQTFTLEDLHEVAVGRISENSRVRDTAQAVWMSFCEARRESEAADPNLETAMTVAYVAMDRDGELAREMVQRALWMAQESDHSFAVDVERMEAYLS